MTPELTVPEYEWSVLGTLVFQAQNKPNLYEAVASEIEPGFFENASSRKLWAVIAEARTAGKPVEEYALYEYARAEGVDLGIDWGSLCYPLISETALRGAVEHLRARAERRQLATLAESLSQETGVPAAELLSRCEDRLKTMRRAETGGPRKLDDVIREALASNYGANKTVPLPLLSEWIEAGSLNVVAGATGVGKTTYGLLCALEAAKRGLKVRYCSLEMAAEELAMRVSTMAVSPEVAGRIEVDDSMPVSLSVLIASLKRWMLRGAGLLIVDHLQCVTAGTSRYPTRRELIADAAAQLKHVARECHVPLIVLSQLSRAPQFRASHRPSLHDLKESGDIENYADRVVLLYRPGYYGEGEEDQAEVILAKNRFGPTGFRAARWDSRQGKWLALSDGE